MLGSIGIRAIWSFTSPAHLCARLAELGESSRTHPRSRATCSSYVPPAPRRRRHRECRRARRVRVAVDALESLPEARPARVVPRHVDRHGVRARSARGPEAIPSFAMTRAAADARGEQVRTTMLTHLFRSHRAAPARARRPRNPSRTRRGWGTPRRRPGRAAARPRGALLHVGRMTLERRARACTRFC